MHKKMELLEQLQRIDLKVDGLMGEKQTLLSEISALEQKQQESRRVLAEKQQRRSELEAEKLGLESSFAAEADNITRAESRQKEIKTQKEYQAVSKEISSAKKQQGELEEQILQKITQIDELNNEMAGLEGDLQSRDQHSDAQKGDVQSKVDKLDQAISKDMAARDEVAAGLPASIVKKYDQLRGKRQGVAVVEAKAGSCLGCNMNLPPQLYNSLFRVNELVSCPHCQRVLFIRQENNSCS